MKTHRNIVFLSKNDKGAQGHYKSVIVGYVRKFIFIYAGSLCGA